ncbi:hypothetical protein YC2023_118305 [Brassica napus]
MREYKKQNVELHYGHPAFSPHAFNGLLICTDMTLPPAKSSDEPISENRLNLHGHMLKDLKLQGCVTSGDLNEDFEDSMVVRRRVITRKYGDRCGADRIAARIRRRRFRFFLFFYRRVRSATDRYTSPDTDADGAKRRGEIEMCG